jgi:hypothetical protein
MPAPLPPAPRTAASASGAPGPSAAPDRPAETRTERRSGALLMSSPPPTAVMARVLARLPTTDSQPGGLPLIALRSPSPDHCGGVRLSVERRGPGAAGEAEVEALLLLPSPTGLDFTPGSDTSVASVRRFQTWIMDVKRRAEAVRARYEAVMYSGAGDAERAAAAGRVVQIDRHVAEALVRAELPADVRTGPYATEAVEAYCAALADHAEPFLLRADSAAERCRPFLAARTVRGWWDEVCAAR